MSLGLCKIKTEDPKMVNNKGECTISTFNLMSIVIYSLPLNEESF